MIFFKEFKDNYGNDGSCLKNLNEYLLHHPNLKVVSSQYVQYTESKYGSGVLNRWDPEHTYLSYKVIVQFEGDSNSEYREDIC